MDKQTIRDVMSMLGKASSDILTKEQRIERARKAGSMKGKRKCVTCSKIIPLKEYSGKGMFKRKK